MKIVRINQIDGVHFTGGTSFRAILERDNMGFSLMKTVIPRGEANHWHYVNHLEACYCIRGKGELVDLSTGVTHLITPDVVYILDKNDDHTFQALEDTVLISVFNPPLTGNESHDKNGYYPASSSIKNKAKEILDAVNNSDNNYDALEAIENILKGKINAIATN